MQIVFDVKLLTDFVWTIKLLFNDLRLMQSTWSHYEINGKNIAGSRLLEY
jgi:hypothetical protein